MTTKQMFPVPMCSSCPHYQMSKELNQYCSGFKRRKPRRFKKSDPKFKVPNWCPRKISPPIYRIYGFKDEQCECMEIFRRIEYEMGKSKHIFPSKLHYQIRKEIHLGMTAKQFYDTVQKEPFYKVFPEKFDFGEIIEIDDGLQLYCFYIMDSCSVIPLPYFQL